MPALDFNKRRFSMVYFGARENALHLRELETLKRLTFLNAEVDSKDDFPGQFQRLKEYSHHYSVRAWNARDGFKPFTKGFSAARFGAPIIASSDDKESRLMLGADYPYLAPSSSLDDLMSTIDFAENTHLGTQWDQAIDTMKQLRTMSCPVATAKQFIEGLRQFAV